jgi:polar amino acid transport system permease protein
MMEAAIKSLPFLAHGLLVTLEITALVVLISLVFGVAMGVALTYGSAWLRWPVRIYSDFIRGIPVLVLIFFAYYGLPALGLNLDNFTAAVVALTAFKISHVIETTRGAIQSIHHGQMEAAKAVDLMLAMQKVIGRTFEPMPIYITGAIIYFLINYSLSTTSRRMEARFSYIRE